MVWGAIIGALLGLASGYENKRAQQKANNQFNDLQNQQIANNNSALIQQLTAQENAIRASNGAQQSVEQDYNSQLMEAISQAEAEPFKQEIASEIEKKRTEGNAAVAAEGVTSDDSIGAAVQGTKSKSYGKTSKAAAERVGERADTLSDRYATVSALEQAPRNQQMDLGSIAAQLAATQQQARDQQRIGQTQVALASRPPYVPQVSGTVTQDTKLAEILGIGSQVAGAYGRSPYLGGQQQNYPNAPTTYGPQ